MSGLVDWFEQLSTPAQSAIISAVVALLTALLTTFGAPSVKYALDKRLEGRELDMTYRFEQQKALKDHLAKHRGEFLEAADTFSHRLMNFQVNADRGWLSLNGNYAGEVGHYANTFAYRFLLFIGAARRMEQEAYFIDTTVAADTDLNFLKALKLNRQVWTDTELFRRWDTTAVRLRTISLLINSLPWRTVSEHNPLPPLRHKSESRATRMSISLSSWTDCALRRHATATIGSCVRSSS
jgi:hypothetical protein